jgi:UDP-N-acetyl-D-glucosamine dehydrogenase
MSKLNISVIGLGFVGLPTACILANSKNKKNKKYFKVFGIDKNLKSVSKNIENINKKNGFSSDIKLNSLIKKTTKSDNFQLFDNFAPIKNSKIILVSVGFDFATGTKKQQFKKLANLFREISSCIRKESLVLIETTLPPGSCDQVIIPTMEKELKKRNINFKKDIYLGFSFERIMPGNSYLDSVVNNHRCYSGMNNTSKVKIRNFLKKFINYKNFSLDELPSLIDCETAKILENSYRALNIAFIDEWTKFALQKNINLNRIIDVIKKRKTHNNIMRPGLGVGGYCLTKDPDFMNVSNTYFLKKKIRFPLINKSLSINRNMPDTSIEFLNKKILNFKSKKILLLGLSYKKDVADQRFSPSKILIDYFLRKKIKFSTQDPFINNLSNFNFKNFDLIIFCVDHSSYKRINIKKFSKKPIYIDLNKVLSPKQVKFMKRKKFKLEILGGN